MGSTDRRDFIELLGAVAVATGVAGCSDVTDPGGGGTDGEDGDTGDGSTDGSGDIGGGEVPAYAAWLPAPAEDPVDDPYFTLGIRTAALQALEDEETATPTPETTPTPTRTPGALVRNPFVAVLTVFFVVGFGLSSYGLSNLSKEEGDSSTDWYVLAERAWVLLGSYDADSLGQQVAESGFSEDGTVGGLTLYTNEEGRAVAVGDSAVVFASESEEREGTPAERVTAVAEAGAGDADSAADAGGAFLWALRTAGRGDAMAGMTTTDDAFERTPTPTPTPTDQGGATFDFPQFSSRLFEGAKAGAQSVTFEAEQGGSAIAAIEYPAGETPPTEDLRSVATGPNVDVDITTGGNRAVLEATWTAEN